MHYNIRLFVLISLLFTLFSTTSCKQNKELSPQVRERLNEISSLYQKREAIDQEKSKTIASIQNDLKRQNQTVQQQYKLFALLFEEFLPFRGKDAIQSSMHMVALAKQLTDQNKIQHAKLCLAEAFISSGLYIETLETIEEINPNTLNKERKAKFYSIKVGLYTQLSALNTIDYYQKKYAELDHQSLDSILHYLPKKSANYLLSSIHKLNRENNPKAAIALAQKSPFLTTLKGRKAAMLYSYLAWSEELQGNGQLRIEHLLKSIEFDIKSSTYETISARVLAQLLSAKGESELAQSFILFALNDAKKYGAQQRIVEISRLVPLIESQVSAQYEQYTQMALLISIILLVSLICIGTLFLRLKRRNNEIEAGNKNIESYNQQLQKRNIELHEANEIKLDYLTNYFETSSLSTLQFEKFQGKIKNFLIQKRYKEMETYLNEESQKNDREVIYEQFDRVFLNLFPSFINDVNELIYPTTNDDTQKHTLHLSAELRVYALQRLGIDSPQRIASILGVSRNTIYAYRNRLKSKTNLDSEQLDEFILNIPMK